MNTIKIPYALDEHGELVNISIADKVNTYFCPSCNQKVILRKGDIRIHHFAHKADNQCSQETALHKTAKILIRNRINNWKQGKESAPVINRKCFICSSVTPQELPEKVDYADIEKRLNNGFIVDIALISGNQPVAAIEVKVTHAVDENKALTITLPFIEVEGEKIINDPSTINPITDAFKPITCINCKERLSKYIARANIVAKKTTIELPDKYYRFGITGCWKCRKEILVFSWPNHDSFGKKEPTELPRPRTIKYRFSNTIKDSYWVNCCPYCDSIQGDFFLYSEPDSPFFGLQTQGNSKDDFIYDMMGIAYRDEFI